MALCAFAVMDGWMGGLTGWIICLFMHIQMGMLLCITTHTHTHTHRQPDCYWLQYPGSLQSVRTQRPQLDPRVLPAAGTALPATASPAEPAFVVCA